MTFSAALSELQGIPTEDEVRDRLRMFMRWGMSRRDAKTLYALWELRRQRNGARIVREILEKRDG